MASVQQAQGVAQINHDKEKAIVSELVKEAQALVEKKRDVVQPQFAAVAGIMRNSMGNPPWIGRPLQLQRILPNRDQYFLVPPTDQIGKEAGSFVHVAQANRIPPPPPEFFECKAGLIYSTFDDGFPQLGYLLAWYKPQSSSEHKVYVQTGDPNVLLKLEWTEIEKNLHASGSISKYLDKETGAFAIAEIHNFSVGGNLAGLGANFTRIPPN